MKSIGDHYHSLDMTPERADEIMKAVVDVTRFQVEGTLPEERLYEAGKIRARLLRGKAKVGGETRAAILKVSFLGREIEEAALINESEEQNESDVIRMPELYGHSGFDVDRGYGYNIQEDVQGHPIFSGLASEEEMGRWLAFYKELKEKAVRESLFPPEGHEDDAQAVSQFRLDRWLSISKTQGHWSKEKEDLVQEHLRQMQEHGISETEFMHGLLHAGGVLVTAEGEHVIMTQDYWMYLPKHSDTVFHIWASLKELRGENILSHEGAIEYCERWRKAYKDIPSIASHPDFDKYFASAMRERALGALIVDLDSDRKNRTGITDKDVEDLKAMFKAIFDHYSKPLK